MSDKDIPRPKSVVTQEQVGHEIRRRQRARATIMAIFLFAFVILIYGISIAKMAAHN